ncbi:MAG: hypothetical protein M3Z23_15200, partial [Acidobacteriota bacterium]|nr:hypothetical protein [Acidobacteriota bacterium]
LPQERATFLEEQRVSHCALAPPHSGPCFEFASSQRCSPSAVRGPVLLTRCSRQRPFLVPPIAEQNGAHHGEREIKEPDAVGR